MRPDGIPGGTGPRLDTQRASRDRASGNRIGLVLGAGGVVGAAWMTGALYAVQDRLPGPLGDADLIVGTSAGSVLAAALRCGVSIEQMIALQRGEPVPELRTAGVRDLDDGPLPPRPQLRAGSPRLMLTTVLTPRRLQPGVGVSAWLPRGRARHEALRATVEALQRLVGQPKPATGGAPEECPPRSGFLAGGSGGGAPPEQHSLG